MQIYELYSSHNQCEDLKSKCEARCNELELACARKIGDCSNACENTLKEVHIINLLKFYVYF